MWYYTGSNPLTLLFVSSLTRVFLRISRLFFFNIWRLTLKTYQHFFSLIKSSRRPVNATDLSGTCSLGPRSPLFCLGVKIRTHIYTWYIMYTLFTTFGFILWKFLYVLEIDSFSLCRILRLLYFQTKNFSCFFILVPFCRFLYLGMVMMLAKTLKMIL